MTNNGIHLYPYSEFKFGFGNPHSAFPRQFDIQDVQDWKYFILHCDQR